ncbi:MAG: DNA repair protein RecN [Clostridia bacterium]|nr:DNA repair protein RecN [Clostridia bacterium]
MLESLHIENLAVIRRIDVDFSEGLNCLTGETGSGKTLIVGSLNLLLGTRVSKDLVRTGEQKAFVSASFRDVPPSVRQSVRDFGIDCDDDALILSKTLDANGRTVSKINGVTVNASMSRQIAQQLLSIHGQHDNYQLQDPRCQRELLDTYADDAALLDAYRKTFDEWTELRQRRDALRKDLLDGERLKELLAYQVSEIEKVNPVPGEEEAGEQKLAVLRNAEKINKNLSFAYYLLKGSEKAAAGLVTEKAAESLSKISDLVPGLPEQISRLEEMSSQLDDIAETIRSQMPGEDASSQIDKIEGRLAAIRKIRKKYGSDIEEVLRFRDEAKERLRHLDLGETEIEDLELDLEKKAEELKKTGSKLSGIRRACASKASAQIRDELAFLDMPKVVFEIEVTDAPEPRSDGTDLIQFKIAPNPGEKLTALSETASGGELARVMLAIRSVLSEKAGSDVSVFDEIDTGISGKTARKVGIKLASISDSSQVICVTHSAQIASLADRHLRVSKSVQGERTETEVTVLDESERVEELARILGGIHVTEAQRQAALDMIREGRNTK